MLTKDDLLKKLNKLSNSKAPENLSFGAMCYELAMPPERAEYVCPKCFEKTLYTMHNAELILSVLPACRIEIDSLKSFNILLDESRLCKKCNPNTEIATIGLIVNIEGQSQPHITYGIDNLDIRLLYEFLSDKKNHRDYYDTETPLKEHLIRIQELLGIRLDQNK